MAKHISICGLPVTVLTPAEMDEAAAKGMVSVHLRVGESDGDVVPGSTIIKCTACDCDVWISPATKQSMPPGVRPFCFPCACGLEASATDRNSVAQEPQEEGGQGRPKDG